MAGLEPYMLHAYTSGLAGPAEGPNQQMAASAELSAREPSHATLGERLLMLREHRGMSQGGLAKLAGLGQATISQIEGGQVTAPRKATVARLARVLHVQASWLLHGLELPSPSPATLNEQGMAQCRLAVIGLEACLLQISPSAPADLAPRLVAGLARSIAEALSELAISRLSRTGH